MRALKWLVVALLGLVLSASAQEAPSPYSLFVHAYTKHPAAQPWMQNETPGLAVRHDASGWMGGVFCNSYSASDMHPEGGAWGRRNCETTYFLGRDLATDRSRLVGLHLLLAAAKGYHRGIDINAGPLQAQLMPIVAPGLRIGPLRVSLLAPGTYHLSIEARL